MSDKNTKKKRYSIGGILVLIVLGLLLSPLILLILLFILLLVPFILIYLVFARYFEMRENVHDKEKRFELKLKTDLNFIKLELAKVKIKNNV